MSDEHTAENRQEPTPEKAKEVVAKPANPETAEVKEVRHEVKDDLQKPESPIDKMWDKAEAKASEVIDDIVAETKIDPNLVEGGATDAALYTASIL